MGGKALGRITMPDGESADSGGLRHTHARQRRTAASYYQQHWFWRDVHGDNLAGDAAGAATERAGNINLLGLVTLTYGIGQIVGPLLTSLLGSGTEAIASATLCGAAALFFGAVISMIQLVKQRQFTQKREC